MQSQTGSADRGGPDGAETASDGLLTPLEVIEEQPLNTRAESYLALHQELSARLEGADAPRHA
ncbi:hypothetical protein ACFRFH_14840 [Leifsonia sp. NPDC056824]|uniref:hypothetical protein n=1 Tax=Leifsonia sp. NPDC056824 TaxID=3345953 RepID=UPI0036789B60